MFPKVQDRHKLGSLLFPNGLDVFYVLIVLMFVLGLGYRVLLCIPLAVYSILVFFNFQGKIFVGDIVSFVTGITLAFYAIIANIEQPLQFFRD